MHLPRVENRKGSVFTRFSNALTNTKADSCAPGTIGGDCTKLTFEGAIDEDSGELTNSRSTDPIEVARCLE